jgi:N-acetylglucosamine kinase-like BadF-type ATPase
VRSARVDTFPLKHLGVDVGGTSTRAHLIGGDGSHLDWTTTGGSVTLDPEGLLDTLLALVRQASPQTACIGLPGGKSSPAAAAWIAQELAVLPLNVTVMSDAELALVAAFGPDCDGIVVCAGTGSVAAVRKAGRSYQVGGHGYLIGDSGGAYDIGRRLLAAALRCRDQGEPDLCREVEGVLGESLDRFLGRVYASPSDRTPVAHLAQELRSIRHPVSKEILVEAAEDLVALAKAAQARFGELPIQLVGGVFRNPVISSTMQEKCGAALTAREPHVAAAYLAAGGWR